MEAKDSREACQAPKEARDSDGSTSSSCETDRFSRSGETTCRRKPPGSPAGWRTSASLKKVGSSRGASSSSPRLATPPVARPWSNTRSSSGPGLRSQPSRSRGWSRFSVCTPTHFGYVNSGTGTWDGRRSRGSFTTRAILSFSPGSGLLLMGVS